MNFHPAEEPLPVRIDQEQLLRVLNNLKENAQRYAGAEPLILDISVKREGENAVSALPTTARACRKISCPTCSSSSGGGTRPGAARGARAAVWGCIS